MPDLNERGLKAVGSWINSFANTFLRVHHKHTIGVTLRSALYSWIDHYGAPGDFFEDAEKAEPEADQRPVLDFETRLQVLETTGEIRVSDLEKRVNEINKVLGKVERLNLADIDRSLNASERRIEELEYVLGLHPSCSECGHKIPLRTWENKKLAEIRKEKS